MVEGIGGYLNAFTSEENTCFYSKARHDRFDELLDVLTDMFVNSTFDRLNRKGARRHQGGTGDVPRPAVSSCSESLTKHYGRGNRWGVR